MRKKIVIGANGQVGRALRQQFRHCTEIEFTNRAELNLADPKVSKSRNWKKYDTIINAAAYTAVDRAESSDGRVAAWATNVTGLAAIARVAAEFDMTLMHISSDYVFDGMADAAYVEDDPVSPLGVYGQTKAAGDALVSTVPNHYIFRTSWVIGDGANFVQTMLSMANRGQNARVVGDQKGRLTFANELALAIKHVLETRPPCGIYNVTGSGRVTSWADIARIVYDRAGHDLGMVIEVDSATYFAEAPVPVAPRPRWSALDLAKIQATGFAPKDSMESLNDYLRDRLADGSET